MSDAPMHVERVRIADVVVDPDRCRAVDAAKAAMIAAAIEAVGLLQPITVARRDDDYWLLIDGAHRLEAAKSLRWKFIPAVISKVLQDGAFGANARLREAVANLMRADLTALDRMAHLAAAKEAHDRLWPGGSKFARRVSTEEAEERARWEIFSHFGFARSAAEACGLTKRVVNADLAIFAALSPDSRQRLRNTPLADRRSELQALAAERHDRQSAILDLLLSTPAGAGSVADAIASIDGRRADTETDRHFKLAIGALGRLPEARRVDLFIHYEADVKRFAQARGWLS